MLVSYCFWIVGDATQRLQKLPQCEPAHIGLLQERLVIEDERGSIMWTHYELISYIFFLAAVTLTGLALFSTLFF